MSEWVSNYVWVGNLCLSRKAMLVWVSYVWVGKLCLGG